MVLQRLGNLLLQCLDAAIEEHAALPADIEQIGSLARKFALVQPPASRKAIREEQFALVARATTATSIARQNVVEEKFLAQPDFRFGRGIVGGERRGALKRLQAGNLAKRPRKADSRRHDYQAHRHSLRPHAAILTGMVRRVDMAPSAGSARATGTSQREESLEVRSWQQTS